MDIEKAKKVINKRTERLLEEFKIEKEVEPEDEPKIAYLMQEIRANKTVLNELDNKDKIINEMGEHIEKGCDFDSTIQTKEQIIDYFIKKVSEK